MTGDIREKLDEIHQDLRSLTNAIKFLARENGRALRKIEELAISQHNVAELAKGVRDAMGYQAQSEADDAAKH